METLSAADVPEGQLPDMDAQSVVTTGTFMPGGLRGGKAGSVWGDDGISTFGADEEKEGEDAMVPHFVPPIKLTLTARHVKSAWRVMPQLSILFEGQKFRTYPFDEKDLMATQVVNEASKTFASLQDLLRGGRVTHLIVDNTCHIECVGDLERWNLSRIFTSAVCKMHSLPLGILAVSGKKINESIAAPGSHLMMTLGLISLTAYRTSRIRDDMILLTTCSKKVVDISEMVHILGRRISANAKPGGKRKRDEDEGGNGRGKRARSDRPDAIMLIDTKDAMTTDRAVQAGPQAVRNFVFHGLAPGTYARRTSTRPLPSSGKRGGAKGASAPSKKRTRAPTLQTVIGLGMVGDRVVAIENQTRDSHGIEWITAHLIGHHKTTRIQASEVTHVDIAEPPRGSTFWRSSSGDSREFEMYVTKSKGPYAVRGGGCVEAEDFKDACAPFDITVNVVHPLKTQLSEDGIQNAVLHDKYVPPTFFQEHKDENEMFAVITCTHKDDGIPLTCYLGSKGFTVVPLCEGSTESHRHKHAFLQRVKKSTPLSNCKPEKLCAKMREMLDSAAVKAVAEEYKDVDPHTLDIAVAGDLLCSRSIPLATSWVEYGARCARVFTMEQCAALPPTLKSYAMAGRILLEAAAHIESEEDDDHAATLSAKAEQQAREAFVYTRAPAIPNQMLEVLYRACYWSRYHKHLPTIQTPDDVCVAFIRDVAMNYGIAAREVGNYEHAKVAAPNAKGRVITRTWEMYIGHAWAKHPTL